MCHGETNCPRCGMPLFGYPAMSRHCSQEICSACGFAEALEDLEMSDLPKKQKEERIIDLLQKWAEPVSVR